MKKRLETLSTYWKQRLRPRLIAFFAHAAMRLLVWTCRVEIEGACAFVYLGKRHPCILMLWHNRLALVAEILKRAASHFDYAALISNSRDGELLAAITDSYAPQARAIRVSHVGKHHALREMIQLLRKGKEILLITPDGPRGPRYQVKPGISLAAQQTDARVVPMTWSASRFWQLNTWDKLIIPKPFSRIVITFGLPMRLQGVDQEIRLEQELSSLTKKTCKQTTSDPSRWPS